VVVVAGAFVGGMVVVAVDAMAVVVVAVVVVVDSRVADDDEVAVDAVGMSTADSDEPPHPDRTTRVTSAGQKATRMAHLPMLIFPHCHCLPGIRRSQQTPPVAAHTGTYGWHERVCLAGCGFVASDETGRCWCPMALVGGGRVGQGVRTSSVWTHTLMDGDVGDGWDGCAWLK